MELDTRGVTFRLRGPQLRAATEDAVAVLRRAVELGVNHIDTASFYAGGLVNRKIAAYLPDVGCLRRRVAKRRPKRRA